MLKIIFSSRFPKDKQDAEFSKNVLQMQEKVDKECLLNTIYIIVEWIIFSLQVYATSF